MKDSSVCCAAHEFDRQGEGRGVEGERERGRDLSLLRGASQVCKECDILGGHQGRVVVGLIYECAPNCCALQSKHARQKTTLEMCGLVASLDMQIFS